MPKKFTGENSKAAVAKARKAATREAEVAKKQQAIEDEYWRDDDKHIQRKQQRKEEKEKKRQEVLDKKAEKKQLEEQELSSLLPNKVVPTKITKAQIQLDLNKKEELKPPAVETHLTKPLEENINRVVVEGETARTVDEAISVLRLSDDPQDRMKSNERNLKAAYAAFEEANMTRLKEENPTLRLSQIKQKLRKEWMRSPENPVNQRLSET